MSADISLLLPTRGRPALVRRFLDSLADTARDLASVEVILYVDDDDLESQAIGHNRVQLQRIVGPVASMGHYNTACLRRASGRILALVNDDIIVRTPGWDDRLRAVDREYADGVYLAYPNDLFKGRSVCTFPILSRAACEALGDPYPEAYQGALIDYHLLDIFKRLSRLGPDRLRYLDDVVFEHAHHRLGKAPLDATYQSRRRFGDDETFINLRGDRQGAAERLAARVSGAAAPAAVPSTVRTDPPRAGFSALLSYARVFLGDRDLPVRWRAFLFAWYCGRHAAGHRWLAPRNPS